MSLGIPAIVIGGGGKTGGFHALSRMDRRDGCVEGRAELTRDRARAGRRAGRERALAREAPGTHPIGLRDQRLGPFPGSSVSGCEPRRRMSAGARGQFSLWVESCLPVVRGRRTERQQRVRKVPFLWQRRTAISCRSAVEVTDKNPHFCGAQVADRVPRAEVPRLLSARPSMSPDLVGQAARSSHKSDRRDSEHP